jgi:hypothetical protein
VTSSENIRRLESIWQTNNTFIDNLGSAIGNLYEGFLVLLTAAKPLVDAFGEFLKNTTESWKETLKLDEATGKLGERFKIAKGISESLGCQCDIEIRKGYPFLKNNPELTQIAIDNAINYSRVNNIFMGF